MVFAISSSENTQKVILSSKLRTGGTAANPKFQLRAPINSPWNQTSLVCLESVIIESPNLFSPNLLNDGDNAFDRCDQFGVVEGDYYNYAWTTAADATISTRPLKDVLKSCIGMNMNNNTNVANLLFEIVNSVRIIKITFFNLPGEDLTKTTILYYNGTATSSLITGVRYIVQGVDKTPTSSGATFTSDVVALIKARLDMQTDCQFSISYIDHFKALASHKDTTGTVKMSGPWLKLLGLNPLLDDYKTEGKYVRLDKNTPLVCTLKVDGYDMIHMHANFARAVLGPAGIADNYCIVPTNILWSIQICSIPGEKTFFTNYNTAGKVVYYMPFIEEIEIYFSDEWGDLITDPIDFQMVLCFDHTEKEQLPEQPSIKRARRMLSEMP
jgi:hypothetical protein